MHDLDDIRRRTMLLMDHLGRRYLHQPLAEMGWGFEFDRARRRMGVCKWRDRPPVVKMICLSAPLARLNGWGVMEDVARHEIAHALDFESRGRSGHDRYWKQWARRCGADPTRTHEGPLEGVQSKYLGVCPACGKGHAFYRKPKRIHGCPDCCHRHNGGTYVERFRLRIVERTRQREAS